MSATHGRVVKCPECGAEMVLRQTEKHRYANGQPRKFWGCPRWPECRGVHGAHPDGRPLGIPADKATKEARIRAHAALDRLWQGGQMTRRQAYRELQIVMGMTEKQAHIGRFSLEQCEELLRRLGVAS